MKELYSHKVLNSFCLWFDHTLADKASAFQNKGTQLYYTPDYRTPNGFLTFSSPFKQWVSDTSVSGANVPTGIFINSISRGRDDGVTFDFENGRVLLNSGSYSQTDSVSGNYSLKEFNVYSVNSEESKIVFEGNYLLNSRFLLNPESGISPYGYAAPACFVMNMSSENKPFSFGGQQDTKNKMRVVVATDNTFMLDGCLSVFNDQTNSIIPLLALKDDPFNEYGDLKSGSYNYNVLAVANQGRYLFLEKVVVTKVFSVEERKMNPSLKFGIIDFYLSEPRFPKDDL